MIRESILRKSILKWLLLSMLPLLLCSCGEKEPKILYSAETVLLENGKPIYAEDSHLEDYISRAYYVWRREGNPDPTLWNGAKAYENGEDYLFEMIDDTYSLQEGVEKWGVRVYFTSDIYLAGPWIHYLNLEKYEDGKWVRQAILAPGRIYGNTVNGTISMISAVKNNGMVLDIGFMPASEWWQESLMLLSPLMVGVDTICPAPTPGQYRFVFYAQLWDEEDDKNPENRMYYIPFEVVE